MVGDAAPGARAGEATMAVAEPRDGRDLLVLTEPKRFLRFLWRPSWGWQLSAAVFAAALLTLTAAHFTQASAGEISVRLRLLASGDTKVEGPTLRVAFGYLLELNHGFFFLVLGPVFVRIGASFITWAGRGLARLETSGYLRAGVDGREATVRRAIEGVKFRGLLGALFRVPLWGWCAIFVVAFYYAHFTDWRNARDDRIWRDIGYMQAPFLHKWVQDFNQSPDDAAAQWRDLSTTDMNRQLSEAVPAWLRTHWSALEKSGRERWAQVLTVRGEQLDPAFPPDALEEGTEISSTAAVDKKLVSFETARLVRSGAAASRPAAYWTFFALSNAVEGTWVGYCAWLFVKILWWLCAIGAGLRMDPALVGSPTRRGKMNGLLGWTDGTGLHIEPLMEDPQKRFGLSELSDAYNRIAMLLAIGAAVCFFAWFSNNAKSVASSSSFVGWCAILVAELVAGGGFAYTTLVLLPGRLRSRRDAWMDQLREASNEARQSGKSVAEIEGRKGLIMEQATWPKSDELFKWLVLATLAFIALPWCLMLSTVPAQVKEPLNVTMHCQQLMRWIAVELGQLPRGGG